MKRIVYTLIPVLLLVGVAIAEEKQNELPIQVLFKNVQVWDGISDGLTKKINILVEGNLIKKLRASESDAHDKALIIEGDGKVLMPGLIDSHVHFSFYPPIASTMRDELDPFFLGIMAAPRAERWLMNGFTTVRDTGGPSKFVQKAIEAGIIIGPRVFPSEAVISQTRGHGDFRAYNDQHPNMTGGTYHYMERYLAIIADGPTEIRRGVRESLRNGATQIKTFTGGGVTSEFDPLFAIQYTPEEIRYIVQAAAQSQTYVMAHSHPDAGIRLAVENGIQCIEHGPFMSEKTAKLMAKKGVFLVPTTYGVLGTPLEEYEGILSPASLAKLKGVYEAYPDALRAAVKHNVKMAFGSDHVGGWQDQLLRDKDQGKEFLTLVKFMEPVDALKMATGNAGELAAMTGPNNPWQEGPLGVIEEGAYADILLIDGNPLENIEIMTDPDNNFRIIMKDGKIYKNTL